MKEKPKIGESIIVVVDNTQDVIYRKGTDHYRAVVGPTSIYEGVVVRNDSLDPPHSLSMTTGLPHFPVRTIALHKIVSWTNAKKRKLRYNVGRKSVKTEEKTWTVKSQSDKRKTYVVTQKGKEWACTCPAFSYGTGSPCKHIREIQKRRKK